MPVPHGAYAAAPISLRPNESIRARNHYAKALRQT